MAPASRTLNCNDSVQGTAKFKLFALVSPSDTTSFKLGRNDRASNFADMAVISDLLEHPPFAALVNHACKVFPSNTIVLCCCSIANADLISVAGFSLANGCDMPVPALHCTCFLVNEDFSPFPRYQDSKAQKIDCAPARSLDNQADQAAHASIGQRVFTI